MRRFLTITIFLLACGSAPAGEWHPGTDGTADKGWWEGTEFKGRWIAETGMYHPWDGKAFGKPWRHTAVAAETDALDEVNRQRATRGLYPYRRCPLLSRAALACARFRSERGIHGHVTGGMGDFQFAQGVMPSATGAEGQGSHGSGWVAADGFGACAIFDSYREAGAAWVVAPNGQMFCSLFLK